MNKGCKVVVKSVPSSHCSFKRIEPCEKAFDFPATSISPQGTTILCCFTFPVTPVRRHLNPLDSKGVVERITVVGTIPNNSSGSSHGDNFIEGSLDKGDFMRGSRIRVQDEWKTRSVCNNHELRTFAPLGLSHFCAPFFAITNVPSMKHSERLMPPRSSRSRARASRIFRNMPDLTHLLNLR